jgi:AAA15 family ATPase/GTPase
MILKALKYSSSWFNKKWSIAGSTTKDDFVPFNNINLIVGRNASGKTHFIQSLRWLSDLFEGDPIAGGLDSIDFEAIFQNDGDEVIYNANFGRNKLTPVENLFINGESKLDRQKGQMYYDQLGQFVNFQIDDNDLAIGRRDNIQQPFFEIFHIWGKNVSHYSFGENMGKLNFVRLEDDVSIDKIHFKDSNNVRGLFHLGKRVVGVKFESIIINDMKRIDYKISSISSESVSNYPVLRVQESDLNFETNFEDMSQGMARAFSLIVQLNYSLMAKIPSCILIDDIGEGLDYDRSKKLIELIIEKAEGSDIQIFMTTNDRFVMNSVPLKYWSVIHREGNKSVFYNYQNSRQTFDDFAFTGFNNFDFFATEFYRLGFEEFIATAQ